MQYTKALLFRSCWRAIWADSLLHRPVWREPTEEETKSVLWRVCSNELAEVHRLDLPWLSQEFGSWWSSQTLWHGRQTSLSPLKWKTRPTISELADLEIQSHGVMVCTLASMRSLRFSTIIGSLVNSSNRYCHSQVSWPNVPLVTKKIPLETKKETSKYTWGS